MAEKLLKLVGPLHVAAGLLLFLSVFSADAGAVLIRAFDLPADHPWSRYFLAFFGPTIASWGILFAGLTRAFLRSPDAVYWRFLVAALLIWAALDTGLCIYLGLWSAAVMNALVLASVLVLLLLLRSRIPARHA